MGSLWKKGGVFSALDISHTCMHRYRLFSALVCTRMRLLVSTPTCTCDACRLILLAVSLVTEYTHSLSGLRESQLPVVADMFELCWSEWSRAEEERKEREQDEQNLYRYRTASHVIEEDGETALKKQLVQMFPEYRQYWEEEEEGEGSCDVVEESCDMVEAQKEEEKEVDGGGVVVRFTPEELQSVASLHLLLYGGDTADTHSDTADASGVTRVESMKMSHDLAAHLAQFLCDIPGRNGICANLGSHFE